MKWLTHTYGQRVRRIVEHAEASANRGSSIAKGIIGKAKPRSEVRVLVFNQRTPNSRIANKRKIRYSIRINDGLITRDKCSVLVLGLVIAQGKFIAQPKIQGQLWSDAPVILCIKVVIVLDPRAIERVGEYRLAG